jgi:hypothetical protein
MIMTHMVVHQLRQVWKIKHDQEKETGLWHLAPSSQERLCLRKCSPSRILVSTMALFRIVRSSSEMIHKSLFGHHSSRNFLMGVIKIAPSWIGSRLGVAQSLKLAPSECESGGYRWIRHAKCIDQNQHRGGRGVGWNLRRILPARLIVPPKRKRIRPRVKRRNSSHIRSHLRDLRTTKQKWSIRMSSASNSNASIRANSWDGI